MDEPKGKQQEKEKEVLSVFDFYNRQLPDYYPSMYLDGYDPY